MNSTFKLSLLAAVFAFAVPGAAMAASNAHHSTHAAKHRTHHVKSKKARHGRAAYNQNKDHQNQATQDLNERSLQTVQSVNRDPNTGALARSPAAAQPGMPTPQAGQPAMQQAPANTMTPPPAMGNTTAPTNAPGAVNPNNMPPAN